MIFPQDPTEKPIKLDSVLQMSDATQAWRPEREALNDGVHTEDSKVMMTITAALGLHAVQCESDAKLRVPVATAQPRPLPL